MKKILSCAWKTAPLYLVVLLVLSFGVGVTTPLITWMETRLINALAVLVEASFSWNRELLSLIFALLFLYAFAYLLPPFSGYLRQMCSLKLDETVKVKIQGKIGRLEYKTLEEPLFRDKWNRVAGKLEERLCELFTSISELFTVAVGVVGLFAYVASVSARLMVFYIGELAVLFCMSKLAARAMFHLNKAFSSSERQVLYLNEITNSKEFAAERKLFGYTPFINQKRSDFMKIQRTQQRKHDFKFAVFSSGIEVTGYIATIIIMIMMLPQLQRKAITLGFFLAFARVTLSMNNTMQYKVKNLLDIMAGQRIFWKEFGELMSTEEQGNVAGRTKPVQNGKAISGDAQSSYEQETDITETFTAIEFRNVAFTYPNGTKVLQGTSFRIEQGKHYALVGENGAGKSTIVKLLLGLYAPTAGEILIDGCNIQEIPRAKLQKFCAAVFQDFARYAIPFEENVILDQAYERRKYEEVLSYAGLTEVEKGLENGKHTMLGKIERDGQDLSGGEWQKLAIARALYRDSRFVIFDEPTASLDPIAESRLYHQYYRMMKGKTTLFISHRLASATLADEILVLADGRICETGTHGELLASKGVYHRLFMAQRRWYWGEEYGNES